MSLSRSAYAVGAFAAVVLGAAPAGAQEARHGRLRVVNENRADKFAQLVNLRYLLDDAEIARFGAGDKAINDSDVAVVDRQLDVGIHRLSVALDFEVKRIAMFAYLKDYKFHVRLRFAFTVEENKSTEVAVTTSVKEGTLLKLQERLAANYLIARSLGTSAGRSDRDHDHVADDADACASEPGSTITQGCPDRDGDGIADARDKCPTKPETLNGFQDDDGCPDEAPVTTEPAKSSPDAAAASPPSSAPAAFAPPTTPEKPEVDTAAIASTVINFEFGVDKVNPRFFSKLDKIVRVLREHPNARPLRIEGHTDDVGGDDYNQGLSERRARAIASYFEAKGIDSARLQVVGFGKQKPREAGTSASARATNRRVEFVLP